jgi:hypothetical protein
VDNIAFPLMVSFHMMALIVHCAAFVTGLMMLQRFQEGVQNINTKEMLDLSGIFYGPYMRRRAWIILISTMASLLFTIKLIDELTLIPVIDVEKAQYYLEWKIIDLLYAILVTAFHLDTLQDKRSRK